MYSEKKGLLLPEKGIFRDYLSAPGRLLNLGCGTGDSSRPLSDFGHLVICVDDAPEDVEQARLSHPDIEFRVGTPTELEFDDCSFDYVFYSNNKLDYLYPLTKRLEAFEEIHRVLKSNGVFVYSSHDRNSLFLPALRKMNGIRYFDGPYHTERTDFGNVVTYYGTPKNNRKQIEKAGFSGFKALLPENCSWRYFVTWKR